MGLLGLQAPLAASLGAQTFLSTNWVGGKCPLGPDHWLTGFDMYNNLQGEHDPKQQQLHTLLILEKDLDRARVHIPGFHDLELFANAALEKSLQNLYDPASEELRLKYAHGLRAGDQTSFFIHRDNKEFPSVLGTAVVKLTADLAGELPSQMQVLGGNVFSYSPGIGSCSIFPADAYHWSLKPQSQTAHLKLAFFFSKKKKRNVAPVDQVRVRFTPPFLSDSPPFLSDS